MTYHYSPTVTDWQYQIILGTILGGSSVVKPHGGKSCYLLMRSRNKDWLTYKAAELKDFCHQNVFTCEGNTTRWRSISYPIFNTFREMFYRDDKRDLTMRVLDQLKDKGFAVWYGDSGCLKDNQVLLNTHKFGIKGSKLVLRYFEEVLIGKGELIKDRNSYRVVLSSGATDKFLKLIACYLPEFMYNKLP